MATNRRRRTRSKRKEAIPDWVRTFLATGAEPQASEDPEAHDSFIGWLYMGESVPGLGDANDYWRRRHHDR